jgi:polyisoprenoid-binding protein YceI
MKKVVLLVASLAIFGLSAQTKSFSTSSKATFEVGNMIFNTVEGSISGARGSAEYEDGILRAISGTLDATTIKSGNDTRDAHLKEKEEFFNTAKTPRIDFTAKEVVFVGKSSGVTTYKLLGSLTLRGVSNDIEIEVQETSKDHLISTFTVNRDLWGLGEGYPGAVIAKEVEVKVDIHLE